MDIPNLPQENEKICRPRNYICRVCKAEDKHYSITCPLNQFCENCHTNDHRTIKCPDIPNLLLMGEGATGKSLIFDHLEKVGFPGSKIEINPLNQQLTNSDEDCSDLFIITHTDKKKEKVLCVKTSDITLNDQVFNLKKDFNTEENLITNKGVFIPRYLAETDESYKQIIPYLVFIHRPSKKIFMMQRKNTGNESRLHSKFTIGIGGHINQSDINGKILKIINLSKREWREEIDYEGKVLYYPLGTIDYNDEVGRVHKGFAFVLLGENVPKIRSEMENGLLVSMTDLKTMTLETWSNELLPHLENLLQNLDQELKGFEDYIF